MNPLTQNKLVILIVTLLSMIAPFCVDTYLPSFPSIASELNASDIEMQQSISLYMIGFAIMTLFYGSISDSLGRRRVILFALSGFCITSLWLALVEDTEMFLLLRLLQGMFASAGVVIGRAVVRDLFRGHQAQQVMAIAMFLFGLGPAFAPVIGGVLEVSFGWRSSFVFLMLLGLVILLLVMTGLKETLPVEKRHAMHPVVLMKNYAHALSRWHFLELGLIVGFNFAGFILYVTAAPQIMFTHLGLSASDFHIMFMPMVGGMMVGALLAGRSAGRISVRRALQAGFLLMFIGAGLNVGLAWWLPVTPFNVIMPLVIYGAGLSYCLPMLSLLGLDELPNHRGLASSLQSFIHMSMNAVVAGIVVPLVFTSTRQMALTMLFCFLVSALMFLNVQRRKSLEYTVDPS